MMSVTRYFYSSCGHALQQAAKEAIDKESCFQSELISRIAYAVMLPIDAIASAADFVLTILLGVAAIATLGTQKKIVKCIFESCPQAILMLFYLYLDVLKLLNPRAVVDDSLAKANNGFIAPYISQPVVNYALECGQSESFLKRHIISRATFLMAPFILVIRGIVDGIVGALAMSASIVTFGKIAWLNNLAARTLATFPATVLDILFSVVGVINPVQLSKWSFEIIQENQAPPPPLRAQIDRFNDFLRVSRGNSYWYQMRI